MNTIAAANAAHAVAVTDVKKLGVVSYNNPKRDFLKGMVISWQSLLR